MKMKEEIRKKILEKRNSLTEEEVRRRSEGIIENLKKLEVYKQAKTVMFYISFKKEVFTHDLIKEALKDKKVVVPKLVDNEIVPSLILNFENLVPNKYDVLEPFVSMAINPKMIDLVIVPGIAFDKSGNRIGFGVGYYDKFLKHVKCKIVGLGYDFQMIEKIEVDDHDVKLNLVVLEEAIDHREA